MPNWCENRLVVAGPIDETTKFYDSLYDSNSNFRFFESFLPTPEELLSINDFSGDGWYQWRIDNWGCKWDASDFHMANHFKFENSLGDNCECYSFDFNTPWCPPLTALFKISAMFPKTVFYIQYEERGMGFGGYSKFINGNEIESQEVELMPQIDYYIDQIQDEYDYDLKNMIG